MSETHSPSATSMTHRERVLAALDHREADRVPVDLGAHDSTGIAGIAYNRLKRHLGITGKLTRINDPYQQLAKVEDGILEWVGADCKTIFFEARAYRPGLLPDGSDCEFPEKWRPELLPDGSEVVKDESGTVIAARPKDGLYFDPVDSPLADCESAMAIEKRKDVFERFDWPFFADQTLEEMGQEAKDLFENTGYLVFGNFPGHIYAGAQQLRGYANFLIDLLANPDIARAIMQNLAEAFMARFDRYAETVGPFVQVISVNDDLGTQEAPQISPELYRKMIKPYHSMLYQHIKKKWPGRLFLHSDGAISPLIPDLIEAGVDILNPIQYSAKDMELSRLKKTFGRDLVFWGGGCDTQKVLPLGSPAEVRDEVRRCIEQLAPGGGFVFCQVHNILADVPPENIAAMYEAVAEYGAYPLAL